jgi:ABC-2 type transport system permease protein
LLFLVYPIIKKEITSYFTSPALYLIATAFLAVAGYLFYGNLVMLLLFQGSAVSVNLWEYTLNDIRLLLMVLVPCITMRTFAEEKKQGTIELLYTAPLQDRAILAGKFVGACCVPVIILACTAAYPLLYGAFYPVVWETVAGGYAGLVLLAMALVALGVFISSLTEQQIIAGGVTLGASFLLWFLNSSTQGGGFLSAVPGFVSLQKHFYGLNRGVIATRDVLFFVFFTLFFLMLTHAWLRQRGTEPQVIRTRWLPVLKIPSARFLIAAVIWCAVFAAGMAAANRWNIRFDITPDKKFTLARVTADALSNLREEFRITVACGNEDRYQLEDFLELFRQSSRFFTYKLMLIDKNPVATQNASLDAQGAGVAEYKGRKVRIEKVHEQAVVQALYELIKGDAKTVRIYSDIPGSSTQQRYDAADTDLRQQGYSLMLSDMRELASIPAATSLVILRDIQEDITPQWLQVLGIFFEAGGRVLLLTGENAMPSLRGFLKKYNIELGTDTLIGPGNSAFDFDPLTQAIFPGKAHPAFEKVSSPAVFYRARSVQVGTEFKDGYTWAILCQSGRSTWAETDPESIVRNAAVFDSGRDIYGPVAAGVTVEKKAEAGDADGVRGRLAVIGTDSFIAEKYYGMLGNADLYKNTVDWLAGREALPVALHKKPAPKPQANIVMTSFQGSLFFWLLVVAEPLLVLLAGIGSTVLKRIKH